MRTVFADTSYLLALWNPNDKAHAKAIEFTRGYGEAMLTTDWIVTELADALCRGANRGTFVRLFQILRRQTSLTVVPASRALLNDSLALYESRLDKEWSLTDCISFVTMTADGITEVLTGDHHFEQAGFTAVLN